MPLFGSFPTYKELSAARCCQCGHPLDGRPVWENYPAGRGAYSQKCNACNLRTYYDISQKEI